MASNQDTLDRDKELIMKVAQNKDYTDWIKLGIKTKMFSAYYKNLVLAYEAGLSKGYDIGYTAKQEDDVALEIVLHRKEKRKKTNKKT